MSNIDPTKPGEGAAYTADVRENFAAARDEIEALVATVDPLVDDVASLTTDVSALQSQINQLVARITVLEGRAPAAVSLTTFDPPNTNSSDFVTAGINVQFTPASSSRAVFTIAGHLGNTQNGSASELELLIGTGLAPPANTDVDTTNGTVVGIPMAMLAAKANDETPFSQTVLLEDLDPGQQYWFGVGYRAVAGTATLSEMALVAFGLIDPITS